MANRSIPWNGWLFDNYRKSEEVQMLKKRKRYIALVAGCALLLMGWSTLPAKTSGTAETPDIYQYLKLFSDVSTILFQLAVTVAALDAIGVF